MPGLHPKKVFGAPFFHDLDDLSCRKTAVEGPSRRGYKLDPCGRGAITPCSRNDDFLLLELWYTLSYLTGMMRALFFARQTLARSSLLCTRRFTSQPGLCFYGTQRLCCLPVYHRWMNPEKHMRAYATSKVLAPNSSDIVCF